MKLSQLDRHGSEKFMYHDTSFLSGIMQHFSTCRRDNRFIDLEVEVKGVIFPCHQILMDAFCPYFTAHFSFSEQQSEGESRVKEAGVKRMERVSLKYEGMSVEGFSTLLDFMYTAELEVNMDNVIDVLRCADFLQFHQVVHLCSTFLHQHITADTCLQMLVIAEAHGLHHLAEKALHFILANFAEVMFQEEFTQLSKEVLVSIVSHPCLHMNTETRVVEAILLWVKGNKNERHPLMSELLQHARLSSLDLEELRQTKRLSTENTEDVIENSESSMTNSESLKPLVQNLNCDDLTQTCLPRRLTEELVVISRKTEYVTATHGKSDWRKVYSYNPSARLWEHRTTLPFSQQEGYTVTVVSNRMHITGGQTLVDKVIINDHVVFNPLDGKWDKRQSMLVPRFHHCAAAVLNKLYVVGGQKWSDAGELLADGEVYDPSTDQWSFIAPVRCISGIGNAALTSLNGKLYILGGVYYSPGQRSSVLYESFSGAQIYDPEKDLWQELVSLERQMTQRHLRLSSGGVLATNGLLILLDDDVGKSHHVYNPVSQTLCPLMQAHGHHWFAGWAVYQGQLVSTGGVEQGQLGMTDMVHAWDLTSDAKGWEMMPSLPKPLSNHACVTLHFPRSGVGVSFNCQTDED